MKNTKTTIMAIALLVTTSFSTAFAAKTVSGSELTIYNKSNNMPVAASLFSLNNQQYCAGSEPFTTVTYFKSADMQCTGKISVELIGTSTNQGNSVYCTWDSSIDANLSVMVDSKNNVSVVDPTSNVVCKFK